MNDRLLQNLKKELHRIQVDQIFNDLIELMANLERTMAEARAAFSTRMALNPFVNPEGLEDHEIELLKTERRQLDESFPQTLRIAAVALVHSALETTLRDTVNLFDPEKSLDYEVMKQSQTFFRKVCASPPSEEEWEEIHDYASIRNCFVHNQGRLNGRPKRLARIRDALERLPNTHVAGGQIFLESEFPLRYAKASEALCKALLRN